MKLCQKCVDAVKEISPQVGQAIERYVFEGTSESSCELLLFMIKDCRIA